MRHWHCPEGCGGGGIGKGQPKFAPIQTTSHVPDPILDIPRELHAAPCMAGGSVHCPRSRAGSVPHRACLAVTEPGDTGALGWGGCALPQTTRSADASSTPRELVARQV